MQVRGIAAIVAGAVLLCSATAAADGERTRPRVGVFVVGQEGPLSPSRQATFLFTMERALEKDRRVRVIDKDRTLAERAGVIPADVISEARGLLETGEALLRKKRPELALTRLQVAVRQIEGSLAWLPKRQLARAQFLLGATYAVLGKKKAAFEQFLALQIWRPSYVVDTSVAPGEVLPLWERARKKAEKMPRGSIEITSSPDRALAYVDGRFVGFTPTSAEGRTVGHHYITFRKLGYQRAIVRAAVSGKVQQAVRADLVPTEGAGDVADLVTAVAPGLGESRAPLALDGLMSMLTIDHAFFVRTPAPGSEDRTYEAFLYSSDGRRLLARASAEQGGDETIDEVFPEIARAIYAQVVFEKPKVKKKNEKVEPPPQTPFYERWWFWTGIGVLAAGGAALPFLLDQEESGPICPAGSVCGEVILEF